jgi:hypothetical protein
MGLLGMAYRPATEPFGGNDHFLIINNYFLNFSFKVKSKQRARKAFDKHLSGRYIQHFDMFTKDPAYSIVLGSKARPAPPCGGPGVKFRRGSMPW